MTLQQTTQTHDAPTHTNTHHQVSDDHMIAMFMTACNGPILWFYYNNCDIKWIHTSNILKFSL